MPYSPDSPPSSGHTFVGRQALQQDFVNGVSSIALPTPIFVATGLEQIGRRSYLGRVCRDNLGLDLGPSFQIDETRGLEDLYLWVLDETFDLGTVRKRCASPAHFRNFQLKPR